MDSLGSNPTDGNARAHGRWGEPRPLRALARLQSYPWFVVGTVCVGAFMGQVDASIAQLVLPELELAFHATIGAVAWVSIAYLLVVAAMLPVFGRLADMFGRKLPYCGGFVVFVAGSALCGLAPDLPALIGARVLQALGAGLLQANSVAIIVSISGSSRRGRALGLQSAAQALGLSTGPALGGFLIGTLGWRWVFWINVPAGLAGVVLGVLVLPQSERPVEPGRFDLIGAMLLVPALALLVLALNETGGARLGPALLIAPGLLGLLLLTGFIYCERREGSPLVDLDLFRNPVFLAGNLAGLLSYAVLFGAFFVLPFAFERAYGDTAFTAGLRLTLIPVALGLIAPLSGALSDRFGTRLLTVTGMIAVGVSMLLLAAVAGTAGRMGLMTGLLALLGGGQGLFTAPNNSAVMASAAAGETGQAGGLLNVMRALGMSLGISIASVILSSQLTAPAAGLPATLGAPGADIIRGTQASFIVFAALALIAALLSLAPRHRHQDRG